MKTKIMLSLAALLVIAFALTGCFDVPPSLYTPIDPDEENAKTPVITSIDKTFMWTDDTLTITGSNFSDSLDENFVYFYSVSEPVIGSTSIVTDSITTGGTYNVVSDFKSISIVTNTYVTTIATVIDAVPTVVAYREPTVTEEYTLTDADEMVLTKVETFPVFTNIDTTTNDTTGYTRMIRTVTTYSDISDWVNHSAQLATVVSASPTQLQVIPPAIDVINSKITIHVQDAIAPGHWSYIDLMVRP